MAMDEPMTAARLCQMGKNYCAIRNYKQGKKYLIQAVIKGSSAGARALLLLGKQFYKAGGKENFLDAEDCFQVLADRGSGESCLYLGRLYRGGLGVDRDIQAAFNYFAEAYELGIATGAYEAGCLIMPDAFVSDDAKQAAIEWFKAAEEEGVIRANTEIGLLLCDNLPEHNREALEWFMKGVRGGDTDAMIYASDLYLSGLGTPKNVTIAMSLLKKAADKGSSKANTILGDLYAAGNYVQKNQAVAQAYYRRAAQREKEHEGARKSRS